MAYHSGHQVRPHVPVLPPWPAQPEQLDVAGKKVTRTFDSGRHIPRCLAVYPDGKAFVSGGTNTTALVWKLADPK